MGAANVIPGVSGGTVAFITGIYERLINAIKSCDLRAVRLACKLRFKDLAAHVDLRFLIAIGVGCVISILSLARILEFFFNKYPIETWAFFFGLIFASVFGIGKLIDRWGLVSFAALGFGVAAAVCVLFFPHGSGSTNQFYLVICGVVAISSMIIPGLSGSFVLLVMGNYALILKALIDFNFDVLAPFFVGCVIGIVSLSHILSWIFRHHRNVALSLITGFVIGSLLLIWPWKEESYRKSIAGDFEVRTEAGEMEPRHGSLEQVKQGLADGDELVVNGYTKWKLPPLKEYSTWIAILFAVYGAAMVLGIDVVGKKNRIKNEEMH